MENGNINPMISNEELKKLSELARIEMSEEELNGLGKDINSILDYIEQITHLPDESQTVAEGTHQPEADQPTAGMDADNLRNVMREDGEPHESGKYTDDLMKEAPDTKDGYVKVKKIL